MRGILITHAHEDHIGALPFLLREINVPVYGTRLTLGFINDKLREHGLDADAKLVTVKPRDVVELGCFSVEFIRVTHSIVDGCGLGITTPVGRVVHTGDFKIDPTPVDNQIMDLRTFAEYGDKGTLVFLSDSTNAGQGGYTFSEKEVRRGMEDIFHRAHGRIVVATFASNIHRVQQIVDVAVMYGRKVILNGKSMISNAQIALDLGYLRMPPETWLKIDSLKNLPDDKVVLITTGSQGEPMSALSRMAANDHKHFQIKKGDTIVLSSKMIPGNERAITGIINHLFKRGAEVFYEKVSEIHVSGHASKEELKLMLNLVKPRYFIPVHGEYRHLVYHSQLAKKVGIPEEHVFILDDGEVMEFTADTRDQGRPGAVRPRADRRQGRRRRRVRGDPRPDAARPRRRRDRDPGHREADGHRHLGPGYRIARVRVRGRFAGASGRGEGPGDGHADDHDPRGQGRLGARFRQGAERAQEVHQQAHGAAAHDPADHHGDMIECSK